MARTAAKTARGPVRARRSGRSAASKPEPAVDMSPGQYIVKVDRASGEPQSDPIEPAELLVHAHRDHHPVEIAAQFLASRLIHVTATRAWSRRASRESSGSARGSGARWGSSPGTRRTQGA